MPFLAPDQLAAIGFKALGKNVHISDKASIYNADQIEIGDNSRIDDFCVVSGKVTIGRNVHVTVFCNIGGGTEGVTIGDFTALSYGCHVFSQSDDYSGATMTNSTVPARFKKEKKSAVHIGRHCILGAHSLVLPGITVAEGCSIGAKTLVRESTQPWSIYVGIPARRIKERKRDLLALEAEYLKSEMHGS